MESKNSVVNKDRRATRRIRSSDEKLEIKHNIDGGTRDRA